MKFFSTFWAFVSLPILSCFADWNVQNNTICFQNNPIHLMGCSWFGFETADFVVNGLWAHDMAWYLDTMKSIGINAIRVPFSAEWVLHDLYAVPDPNHFSADPSLKGQSSIYIMDRLFELCLRKNILIMLDLHRLHKEYISEVWYSPTDGDYTSDTFFQVWDFMLDRYLPYPNLFAIDLLNEPHGIATWGTRDPSTDWGMFVQNAVPKLLSKYADSNFLVFIEGVEWGHTFRNYRSAPLQFSSNRIVFSPHTYGKSVVPSTSTDYGVLYSQWDQDFGFLLELGSNYTFVIGEWGGKTNLDQQWMTILKDYLSFRNQHNNFFWSLGPNSGDVQGLLLDDWTRIDGFKQSLMQQIVPNPSIFHFQ